jgi:hypothetical protein
MNQTERQKLLGLERRAILRQAKALEDQAQALKDQAQALKDRASTLEKMMSLDASVEIG